MNTANNNWGQNDSGHGETANLFKLNGALFNMELSVCFRAGPSPPSRPKMHTLFSEHRVRAFENSGKN